MHALTPQTLILATDSGALHLYDLRKNSFTDPKPQQTHRPHGDYISSLTPLPPTDNSTSGFSKQWVTTGGSTIAVTDVRRGVLVKSEDQGEELLSSTFVVGLPAKPGRGVGEKLLVGSGGGVLTLWERGRWDDQDDRIIVDRGGESLDTIAPMPGGVGPGGKVVAVGLGDGRIKFVELGPNKVIAEVRHDEVESVVSVGFDVASRMISGGGQVVKVWHEKAESDEEDGEDEEEKDGTTGSSKRRTTSDSDDDVNSEGDSSDSDKQQKKRKKKRKRRKGNKGKAPKNPNDVVAFKGLD